MRGGHTWSNWRSGHVGCCRVEPAACPSAAGPAWRAGRSWGGEHRRSVAGRGARAGRHRRSFGAGTAGARRSGRCGGAPVWRVGGTARAGANGARTVSRSGERLRSPRRRRRAAAGSGPARTAVPLCAPSSHRDRPAAPDRGRAGGPRSAAPVGGRDDAAALRAGGAARTAGGAHAAPADQSAAVLRRAGRAIGVVVTPTGARARNSDRRGPGHDCRGVVIAPRRVYPAAHELAVGGVDATEFWLRRPRVSALRGSSRADPTCRPPVAHWPSTA